MRRELAQLDKVASRARAAVVVREGESTIRVERLLLSCRSTGPKAVRSWLLCSHVVGSARVCDVPPGKRERLARLVES